MANARADEYRRKAEECRLQASQTTRDDDKAAWLTMAQDWQRRAESVDAAERRGLEPPAARSDGCGAERKTPPSD